MKASAIVKALPKFFESKMSVFIKGAVGVGKSSIVQAVGKNLDIEVRDWMRASQMDPTDIKGFPAPDAKKDVMRWLPPDFFPTDPKSKGILFLDELTSGSPAVQAAMYQLMLDRRIGNRELPDGWGIVAAGNREIDRSIVNRMPAALANRMVHIDYELDIADWTAWALNDGTVSPETIAFLRFRESLLHTFDPKSSETVFATPRTWVMADEIRKHGHDAATELELIQGTVGKGPATEYTAFARMAAQLPSREAIAMNPDGAVLPTAPNAQYAVVTMLSAATTDVKAFQTFVKYVTRLPVEFQVVYMRDLLSLPHGGSCQATKEFINWGMKHSNIVL